MYTSYTIKNIQSASLIANGFIEVRIITVKVYVLMKKYKNLIDSYIIDTQI